MRNKSFVSAWTWTVLWNYPSLNEAISEYLHVFEKNGNSCFSSSTHGVNSSGERLQCRFQLSAATLLWSFLRSPIPGIGKRKFCKCSKLLTIPFKIALKRSQTWWGYSILSCWVLSAFVMKEKKRNLNLKSQHNHCFEGMICVSFPTRCWAFYFSSAWCAILCMAISYTRE